MSDSKLQSRAYQILTAMTENPNFKTPSPSIEVVSGIITEFFDALNLCKDGDRLKVAIKNQKREALINTLHSWASYVLFKSSGDSVVAFSSGFTIGKTSTPTAPLIKPANLSIENGITPPASW